MFSRRVAFPRTHVWLAAYQGWRGVYHHPSQLHFASERLTGDGYATTLSIGRLVIQVVGWVGLEEDVSIAKGGWAMSALTIWPTSGESVWPPPAVLDDDALLAFAARFEGS